MRLLRIVPPNVVLRRLLAETGWTEARLAREVNAAGAETGLALRYDRSAVSHWLAGRRPWGPVPSLLAETLSRGLRRTVTVAELGLDARRSSDTASVKLEVSAVGSYRLAALAVPTWERASVTSSGACSVPDPPSRLTAGQIASAEQMAALFDESDAAFGGGRTRVALAGYLAHDVVPLLRLAARPALRARMFTVATQLSYLCAFMCFDDERHALAQRYYLTALDLATENGDAPGYAIAQRALSVQAGILGHHPEALALAEDAARTGRRVLPPGRHAFFVGQLAVAQAATDDRRGALATLRTAERLHSRADPVSAPMGGYHLAAMYHQVAEACALLGDRAESVTALSESVRHRPVHERRSRAVITARLAEHQLATGHLEEAVATWHAFLDDYPLLRSGRATSALRGMRSRLRPHSGNVAVARLLTRAATVVSSVLHPLCCDVVA
jgi:tetratricopeptide (TPR) repeat protein